MQFKVWQIVEVIVKSTVRVYNRLSLDGSSARSRSNWRASLLATVLLVTLVAVSVYTIDEYTINKEISKVNTSLHAEVVVLKAEISKYEPTTIIVNQNRSLLEQNYLLGDKIMQLRAENLRLDEENYLLKKEVLECSLGNKKSN